MTIRKSPASKLSLSDAIAARKAALVPKEPAELSPQAILDRKKTFAQYAEELMVLGSRLKSLEAKVEKIKRADFEAIGKAIFMLDVALKDARKER